MDTKTLAADLSAHILRGNADDFEPLALRVFAYQYANNAPYRRFCEGRKQTPDTVTRWQDIPPAPAAAFKRFALTCADPALCVPEHGGRTFHSSGTTGSETSKHYMDAAALSLYRASLLAGYAYFVDCDGRHLPVLSLVPRATDSSHSSLAFMQEELHKIYGGQFFMDEASVSPHTWQQNVFDYFWRPAPWKVAPEGSPTKYVPTDVEAPAKPVVLFGTAFAWVQFFDEVWDGLPYMHDFPKSSCVVETGGFKGRSREVSRDELYRMFTDGLEVPVTHCVAEYGMSEMASQFYDTTYRDHITGVVREPRKTGLPHLVRTRVIDPVTGQEARLGEPGILAHYDVCNLNSCLAIQTEDYGYAHPDGEGFVLLGRAPGATLRGCSLTAEEFAARQQNR